MMEPMPRPGFVMAGDRMRRRIKHLALARARPVRCEDCGAELFRVVPIPWRGGVKLVGAEAALVHVDFGSMNDLVFRHVEPDRCRRPGV
jgi:hypothetical protein